MKEITRRNFLKMMGAVTAATGLGEAISPIEALAEAPWMQSDKSILIGDENTWTLSEMFIPMKGIKNECPDLALGKDGHPWLCWTTENKDGEVINLGSGDTYSVNRLVELLEGDVVYVPKRPGEPDCTFADITKAQKLLNYSPQISFESGVSIMLDNIDHWKDAPVWTSGKIKKATEDWFLHLSK